MSESNTRVEIIETMADGICDAIDADGLVRPEYAASAALTALEAAGMAVVPGWRKVGEAPETDVGKPVPVLAYGKAVGVYFGHLHRLPNCSPVINVAHLHGDAISDWGVTKYMPLPPSPKE